MTIDLYTLLFIQSPPLSRDLKRIAEQAFPLVPEFHSTLVGS